MVKLARNRLTDGRVIRAVIDEKGTVGIKGQNIFTQDQMFFLKAKGLLLPSETIMGIRDHDIYIQQGHWGAVDANWWWRSGSYAAYRRGFEQEELPIGEKLVLVENGIARILEIPDVPVAIIRSDGKSEIIGLREARGLLDFNFGKLRYDSDERVVSVTTDFNPETDVHVVDVMRPRGWALADSRGHPLRTQPSEDVQDARYSYVRHSDEFEDDSTGYHGSEVRGVYKVKWRYVIADADWSDASGVRVVSSAENKS